MIVNSLKSSKVLLFLFYFAADDHCAPYTKLSLPPGSAEVHVHVFPVHTIVSVSP